MAVQESYDFEDGTLQGWTVVENSTDTIGVGAAYALNGSSYGVGFECNGGGDDTYITRALGQAYSDIYVQCRIQPGGSSQFTTSEQAIMIFYVSGGTWSERGEIQLHWHNDGSFQLAESLGGTAINVVADTEILLEVRYVQHATTGGFQVWVDGTLEIDALSYNTSAQGTENLILGVHNTHSIASGAYLYFDDVQIGDAYIGAGDTTPPAEVTGLAATPGDTQVTLTWTDPGDADFDHVEITHDQTGGSTPVTVSAGTQTYTWTSLTNGTEYTFTAQTVDTSSNASTGETVAATPTAGGSVVPIIIQQMGG